MGIACGRRRPGIAIGTIVIPDRWSRLVVRYLKVIRHVADGQRIFSAASVQLRVHHRSLSDNSTRARRLELI